MTDVGSPVERGWRLLGALSHPAPPNPVALSWFPIRGLALGFMIGAAYELAEEWWTFPVAAGFALCAEVALTRGLPYDGVADTTQALVPSNLSRQQRLDAMHARGIAGAAIGALVIVLFMRAVAITEVGQRWPAPGVIAAMWALSRTVTAVTVGVGRHARLERRAAEVAPWAVGMAAVIGGGLSAFLLGLTVPWQTAVFTFVATAAVTTAVVVAARIRLGGYTADVLGAATVLGETAGLLVIHATWPWVNPLG